MLGLSTGAKETYDIQSQPYKHKKQPIVSRNPLKLHANILLRFYTNMINYI